MKTKKIRNTFILTLLLSFIFVLTGCGTSNRKTLVDYYDKQASQKFTVTTTKTKLEKLSASNLGSNAAQNRAYAALFEGTTVTGKSIYDGKKTETKIDFQLMGQDIPINMFSDGKSTYLSLDYLASLAKLSSRANGATQNPQIDFNKIKGKYVDVFALAQVSNTASPRYSGQQLSQLQQLVTKNLKNLPQMQKAQASALEDTIKKIPEKSVSKKGDVVTTTLHKSDVLHYQKTFLKNLKKSLGKDSDILQSNPDNLDKTVKKIKTLDLTINYKPKSNKASYVLLVEPTENEKTQLRFNSTYSNRKEKVQAPAPSDILSTADLTKIFGNPKQGQK